MYNLNADKNKDKINAIMPLWFGMLSEVFGDCDCFFEIHKVCDLGNWEPFANYGAKSWVLF